MYLSLRLHVKIGPLKASFLVQLIMEYLLSNCDFKNSTPYKSLFYNGNFKILGDKLELLEHNFVFDKTKFDSGLSFPGPFNHVSYSATEQTISIRNDELGMLQLYFAVIQSKVFVSNNIWLILEQLDSNEISLNESILAAYLQYARIPSETETFFKNIHVLPVGSSCTIDLSHFTYTIDKTWDLTHSYQSPPSLDEAVDQLYDDLSSLFGFIKQKDPNRTVGFGNSGGLDSRLVPHFCEIHNLQCKGFITGKTHPRFGLTSTSHSSAHKVAALYKLDHTDLSYRPTDYNSRLLLDVKNNLLSNCQVFKNPYDQLPEFDTLICGGNGFIVSNDSNKWKAFDQLTTVDEKTNYLQAYVGKFGFAQFSQKLAKKLGNTSQPNAWYFDLFKGYKDEIATSFRSFVQENNQKDNLSLIRSFHQSIFNRNSPAGGFESINRTKDFSYLYYPFTLRHSLSWPLEYYLDRKVLQQVMQRKIPSLTQIPDQAGQSLFSTKKSKLAELAAKIRGNGLDYRNWYNSDRNLHAYMHEVFSRKNPMFDDFIQVELDQNDILRLHPFICLDFLKAKKALDIIYFREFEQLKKAEFTIA